MPPMGGVTGAMKGSRINMGSGKEKPKNLKNTVLQIGRASCRERV